MTDIIDNRYAILRICGGSGTFIKCGDYYGIVTNKHVIEDSNGDIVNIHNISITFNSKSSNEINK